MCHYESRSSLMNLTRHVEIYEYVLIEAKQGLQKMSF